MPRRVEIIEKRREYDGFFKLDRAFLRYEKFDGSMSDTVERLLFDRGDSVAVLPYDEASDEVLLVQQYRYPAYVNDGPGWLWEAVAGMREQGNPAAVARQELLEEAGYEVERLEHIMTFYPSPGGSSERICLYLGYIGSKIADGGGVPEAGEDTLVKRFSWKEAYGMVQDSQICDAKTVIALQYLALRKAGQV
jgi:ADP-ribose pyrophosphatase